MFLTDDGEVKFEPRLLHIDDKGPTNTVSYIEDILQQNEIPFAYLKNYISCESLIWVQLPLGKYLGVLKHDVSSKQFTKDYLLNN